MSTPAPEPAAAPWPDRLRVRSFWIAGGLFALFVPAACLTPSARELIGLALFVWMFAFSWALVPFWPQWVGARSRNSALRIHAAVTTAVLVVAAATGTTAFQFRASREWTDRKARVLTTARAGGDWQFVTALQEAKKQASRAQLDELREALGKDAAEGSEWAGRIDACAAGGWFEQGEQLCQGLRAVNRETPPSPARDGRERALHRAEIDLHHAWALAEVARGRWPEAFRHHAAAADLCPDPERSDREQVLHDQMAERLRDWLIEQRPALVQARSRKDERELARVLATVEGLRQELQRHEARVTARACTKPWDPAELDAAVERALRGARGK